MAQVKQEAKHPPGYYPVALDGLTGHIRFPAPLMRHHFEAWWQTAVEGTRSLDKREGAYWAAQWQAYKRLLLDFGEWDVEQVPRGEAEADNLPVELTEFVLLCGENYILPKLSPARRRLIPSAF